MVEQRATDERDDRHEHRVKGRAVQALIAVGLVIAGVAAGAFLGYALTRSQAAEAEAEADQAREDLERLAQAHETLQERNWILYLDLQAAQAEGQSDSEPAVPGVFTDGTYEVGRDIEPGTYRGTVNGEWGYWARLRNTSGMVSGIVANNVERGPFVLTIVPSDIAVELRGVTLTAEE